MILRITSHPSFDVQHQRIEVIGRPRVHIGASTELRAKSLLKPTQGRRAAETSGPSTLVLSPTKKCPTNLSNNICHVLLKFNQFCIKRLFLIFQSSLDSFSLFLSSICAIFHDQLQSDSIYSPTPGTSV